MIVAPAAANQFAMNWGTKTVLETKAVLAIGIQRRFLRQYQARFCPAEVLILVAPTAAKDGVQGCKVMAPHAVGEVKHLSQNQSQHQLCQVTLAEANAWVTMVVVQAVVRQHAVSSKAKILTASG